MAKIRQFALRALVAILGLGLGCGPSGDPPLGSHHEADTYPPGILHSFLTWDDGWDPLGGGAIGNPAITRRADGSVDIFVLGYDHAIYQQHWDGTRWSGFLSLGNGGRPLDAFSATAAGDNLWIFGTQSSTGNLVMLMWNGTNWLPWQNLGGVIVGTPSSLAYYAWERGWNYMRLATQVVVVARNASNQLFSIQGSDSGVWQPWHYMQGYSDADAALTSWGIDRVDVVVKGLSNQVYHTCWNAGTWYGSWVNLGGWTSSAPAVTAWGPNRLDIVVDWGDRGSIRHKAWNGTWSDWYTLGGVPWSDVMDPLAARPAIASPREGSLEVLVQGTDRALYHDSWTPETGTWSGWYQVASCFRTRGTPSIVSDGNGTMDLALADHYRATWHNRFAWNYIGEGGPTPPSCPCGGLGNECCFQSTCPNGGDWNQCQSTPGVEVTDTCQSCGATDQPPCWGIRCEPGLAALIPPSGNDVRCQPPCGLGPGFPCCVHDYDNYHLGCGDPTQTFAKCGPSTRWSTGQCVSCGHPGEECCNWWQFGGVIDGICTSGSSCHPAAGSTHPHCTLDVPAPHCGKLFEPCCASAAPCQPGEGICSAGYCVVPPTPSDVSPDLVPGAPLSTSPTILRADEPFTLSWLTCNNGSSDTDDFVDAVWLDGNQVDVEPENRLYPGQCDNASFTFSDGLSLGHHQVIVYIDIYNMVDESRENNNSPELDIFVQ